ncbi:S-methyl-5-thioribose-1-phosphate isomerase [Magnetospira sp. QH-2]|uniref:S-methyl-5-thioribose-1-phosphate isomerase n=1 Tax=Magnetospira sp. (strain QH-2) TaxID=1288970 RepID=UPI0003E8183A|nr:S-methyl-5-thioribose-1-phosphate isomerase [Magnetospira sp. QH-2]CCQ72625.1 5-methylthioribose-1-phosphate isomerase (MTNA) [Magnetospira sp. QH-2]
MNINGTHYRTIWTAADERSVEIIDQTRLPHLFEVVRLTTMEDAAAAIADMLVRGAPLIGSTAAYGMALAMRTDASDKNLEAASAALFKTRPTAVNLRWALDEMKSLLAPLPAAEREEAAYIRAAEIADEDVGLCEAMGDNGLTIIREIWEKKGKQGAVNVLTHCNAGWLATVDWGTATAPIYKAHNAGIPVHVWVDETRPRNQGFNLTAFELGQHGVPHTCIVDNVGGHLMQHGEVDLCIVGTDRTTASGDVCNKIGTYLKALAAHDNGVPFYVCLPSPTIDWRVHDGVKEIPIEQRDGTEVTEIWGRTENGGTGTVTVIPEGSEAANYAFDVTPARLVTGLITERGVAEASRQALADMFPEKVDS